MVALVGRGGNHTKPQPDRPQMNEKSIQTDVTEKVTLEPIAADAQCSDVSVSTDRDDAAKQEQYRREHLQQLRLRSCPGCGEEGLF